MDKKLMTIIFDMDGTLCSTYDVPNWLEMLRNYDTTPYTIAQPMWDFTQLNAAITALMEVGVEKIAPMISTIVLVKPNAAG